MSAPTIWTARRVGDRILCGRRERDGRYCPALVAHLEGTVIVLPPGRTSENADAQHFRLTKYAAAQAAPLRAVRAEGPALAAGADLWMEPAGRLVDSRSRSRRRSIQVVRGALPIETPCDRRHVNLVDIALADATIKAPNE